MCLDFWRSQNFNWRSYWPLARVFVIELIANVWIELESCLRDAILRPVRSVHILIYESLDDEAINMSCSVPAEILTALTGFVWFLRVWILFFVRRSQTFTLVSTDPLTSKWLPDVVQSYAAMHEHFDRCSLNVRTTRHCSTSQTIMDPAPLPMNKYRSSFEKVQHVISDEKPS